MTLALSPMRIGEEMPDTDIGTTFAEAGLDWKGWEPIGRRFTEQQLERGIDLINNKAGLLPHRHEFALMEAITTTDFPYLFGTVIERELMAQYGIVQPEFRAYTKMGTVPNFNQHTRHRRNGGRGKLREVIEKGEYLVTPGSDTRYLRQVRKFGEQLDISWESLVNDGMGAFDDIPEDYSKMAINTEHDEVTGLYAAATGPDPLLFGAPIVDVNTVNVTNLGVLALTPANLQTTLDLMALQTDVNGRPLTIMGLHLVVPIQLDNTAWQMLNSVQIQYADTAGAVVPMGTTSPIPRKGIQLHIDPWLPQIDTSGNVGTTWYVFADTGFGHAIGLDFLRGHEGPEICMKASNKVTMTGAPISPFDGDFLSDDVMYRVRVCLGGNYLDPRCAYAQTGTG